MTKQFCALCGMPLDELVPQVLTCCGESQSFCLLCYDEMAAMDPIRRARILLKEGRAAVNAEAMQEALDRLDGRADADRAAEPTALSCLRCGAPMVKAGRKKFKTGEDAFFFDEPIPGGSVELDILRCTNCRKVEFFAPE